MPTDFRYVPTSGPLSGASFEGQTEHAFNELGGRIDTAETNVNGAIAIARQAESVAQNALGAADAATGAVAAASDAASAASEAAAGADIKAAEAQRRANSAYDMAANAITASGDAANVAGIAQATAADAKTTALEAQLVATVAETTANAAIERVAGSGIFTTDPSVRDADAAFDGPERSLLTNTDATTPNSNFPSGVTMPAWFMVFVDGGGTAATQFCWNNTGAMYIRTAAIEDNGEEEGEEEEPLVAWSGWVSGGGGGSAIIGKIELLPFRVSDLAEHCPGWHFCNGDLYPLSSAVGAALEGLPDNFKTDWDIVEDGDGNISIPNLFYSDGRGYFLRAVDGTVHRVGNAQQDYMRRITGELRIMARSVSGASGAFYTGSNASVTGSSTVNDAPGWTYFDSARLGENYNGSETTPLNTGMTPAIFLGV